MKSGDMAEERELLLRLFQLLLENIGELLEDDSWLRGQVANVQETLSGHIDYVVLMDASRSLKEVIYKQSMLKHSLAEAKTRVKDMMITVIDRLGTVAANTSDYRKKIDNYSQQISQATDAVNLNKVLDDLSRDTRMAQIETLRSQDDIIAARHEVQAAETRIHALESELAQMSELAREDQLTGSLNRRGLDDFLEREIARSERRKSPLCAALLDLDNFKRLNDTYGHHTGDQALVHLVSVVKDTLRAMDVIGRFGGEEFVIVLPDTPLDEAMQTVTRVQRELTKRIFMHNNERLLITFSSGVALRMPGESPADLIKRADEALYKAKRAGKNRVISAT
ncbi:MAG TPA: diguanylate cyclase [Noviherbaspirillum sp.]|nr:diguanylate cyclase [Noviherbaspirillum sp.]